MRLFLAILLLLAPVARSAIINCSDTTRTVVNTAINTTAVAGDTVVVPAGSSTWATAITVDKTLTIQGAGVGNTVITDGTSVDGAFILKLTAADFVHLTGFEFISSGTHTSDGILNAEGLNNTIVTNLTFRIDHFRITVSSAVTRGIKTTGVYGLIDHGTFWMTSASGSVQMLSFWGSSDGNDGGFTPWTWPLRLGSTNAVYVEDCSFTNANRVESIMDAYGGARFVCRYNAITNGEFGSCHGTDSGDRRSAHSYEVYRNVYHNNCGVAIRAGTIRGGTGVFHDNIYTASGGGSSWGGVNLMYYRMTTTLDASSWDRCSGTVWELGSANLSNQGSRTCTTTGNVRFCSGDNSTIGAEGGACTGGTYSLAFDGTGTSGYPGRDQPGYTTGMVLSPVYAWNQTNAGSLGTYDGGEPHVGGLGIETWMAEGRDYTNSTVMPGYTPLVYPHPLNTDNVPDSSGTYRRLTTRLRLTR